MKHSKVLYIDEENGTILTEEDLCSDFDFQEYGKYLLESVGTVTSDTRYVAKKAKKKAAK